MTGGNEEIGESSCDGDLCGGVMAEEGKVALVFGIYANTQILGLKKPWPRKKVSTLCFFFWWRLETASKQTYFYPNFLLDLHLKSWRPSWYHFGVRGASKTMCF